MSVKERHWHCMKNSKMQEWMTFKKQSLFNFKYKILEYRTEPDEKGFFSSTVLITYNNK